MFELVLILGVAFIFLGTFSFLPKLALPNIEKKKPTKQKDVKVDPMYQTLYDRWFGAACKTYELEDNVSIRTFPDMCIPDSFVVVSNNNGFEVKRKRPSLLEIIRAEGFEG